VVIGERATPRCVRAPATITERSTDMTGIFRDEVPIAIEGDGVELRMRAEGALTVAFVRLPSGANLAPALRGRPGDRCPCPHWGYMLKGRVRMHAADGASEFVAGQAFYWAPGHVPEAVEDSEYVDFSPTREFQQVINHIRRG
jgi:hypothetical protein